MGFAHPQQEVIEGLYDETKAVDNLIKEAERLKSIGEI